MKRKKRCPWSEGRLGQGGVICLNQPFAFGMFRLPVENLLGRCRLADEWKDLVKMLEDSFKEHAPTMQLQVDEKSFTDVFYISEVLNELY